jgi:hypothetical protein
VPRQRILSRPGPGISLGSGRHPASSRRRAGRIGPTRQTGSAIAAQRRDQLHPEISHEGRAATVAHHRPPRRTLDAAPDCLENSDVCRGAPANGKKRVAPPLGRQAHQRRWSRQPGGDLATVVAPQQTFQSRGTRKQIIGAGEQAQSTAVP